MNCVVSTDIFLETDLSIYNESVLISPIYENKQVVEKLTVFVKNGGRVVFYGTDCS